MQNALQANRAPQEVVPFHEQRVELTVVTDCRSKIAELLRRRDMKHVLTRLKNRNLSEKSRLRFGEYKRFLAQIHALVVREGQGFHQRKQACVTRWDGKKTTCTYRSPHFEDRDFLIQKMLDAARSIPDPKDVGLLLYVLTNFLHGLQDGNGRISRFLYGILNDFSEEQLSALLAHDRMPNGRAVMRQYVKDPIEIAGRVIKDMTPVHCDGYVQVIGTLCATDIDKLKEASLEDGIKEDLQAMLSEERAGTFAQYQIRDLILFAFKAAHPEIAVDAYEERFEGGRRYLFDAGQLISSPSHDQALELLAIERTMKREFALHAIDIIERPYSHTGDDGKFLKDNWYA